MNHLKRLLAAALAFCMVLCLCACGNTEPTPATEPATDPVVTDPVTEPADDGKVTYKVTVQDEGGNPVSGALVQLCLDACVPAMTNDKGVAEWNVEEADYKVSFAVMPVGYDYATDTQEFYFDDGSYEMTLTLQLAA